MHMYANSAWRRNTTNFTRTQRSSNISKNTQQILFPAMSIVRRFSLGNLLMTQGLSFSIFTQCKVLMCLSCRCNSTLTCKGDCTAQTVTKWHSILAKHIRSIDPNHLITSGYVLLKIMLYVADPDLHPIVTMDSSVRIVPNSSRYRSLRLLHLSLPQHLVNAVASFNL